MRPSEKSESADPRFEALYREITSAVAAVCPAWLAAHGDDIAQKAMLRVVAQLDRRGEGDEPLGSSYMWRVAHSVTVDEIRKLRRSREVVMETEELTRAAIDGASGPEREQLGRETGQAIMGCLRNMVRPRRLAVILYLQGYGVPESAELLDWNRKRVENLVYRGLADLRACLRAKGVEP